MFKTYYGETFTKSKITQAILELKGKGTFHKDWGPMDLRHSFAVTCIRNGEGIKELQYI